MSDLPFSDAIEKIAGLHTADEPLSTQRAANALGVTLDVKTIIGARMELQLHALMRRSGFVPTMFPIEPSAPWRPVWPIVIINDNNASDDIFDEQSWAEWQECPDVPAVMRRIDGRTEVTFADLCEHASRNLTVYEVDAIMAAIGWERCLLPCGPARIAGWRKREVAPIDDDGGTLGDASGDASGE